MNAKIAKRQKSCTRHLSFTQRQDELSNIHANKTPYESY